LADNQVQLQLSTGKYLGLSANAANARLVAEVDTPDLWETFQATYVDLNEHIQLKGFNNRFVTVNGCDLFVVLLSLSIN
jgi:hypothetical protein